MNYLPEEYPRSDTVDSQG